MDEGHGVSNGQVAPQWASRPADRRDQMAEPLSDLELVARARADDDNAFRALVERHQRAVAGVVIRMMGPGDDTEDIGQETFIRFFRALGSFRGEAGVRTYLVRIAMNLSLNALRRRRRRLLRFLRADDLVGTAAEPRHDGEAGQEALDLEARLSAAVERLDPAHRSVVVLRLLEGYSTRETAELLRVPEGTVMSRVALDLGPLEEER